MQINHMDIRNGGRDLAAAKSYAELALRVAIAGESALENMQADKTLDKEYRKAHKAVAALSKAINDLGAVNIELLQTWPAPKKPAGICGTFFGAAGACVEGAL